MDFNINNETFKNAYKCLYDANVLLQNGLGNFNELDSNALTLIGKNGVSNSDKLNNSTMDCSELMDKMYRTIESLAAMDINSENCFMDILCGSSLINYDWDGTKLTAPMGVNYNGPSGSETWYDLNMSRVVENMEKKYGFTNLEYSIREDGVKVLSGVTPDGEKFENLVIVAADVYHESANPSGTFERGQIVETSLGIGIVADYCGRSESVRKSSGGVHFDIATAWHTGQYMAAAYSKNPQSFSDEVFEQVVPNSSVKTINIDIDTNIEYDGVSSFGDVAADAIPSLKGKDVLLRDGTDIKGTFNADNYKSPDIPVGNNTNVANNSDNAVYSSKEKDVLLRDGTDIKGTFNADEYKGLGIPNGNNKDIIVNSESISNIQPKNNPLVAHRGYHPGGVFENSKESFILAGQSGFWGCEADVRFDNDRNLVCSHNAVKNGENPPSFEEYLDICKEYGMTPVIDIKYENGTEVLDYDLSPAILQVIEDKGMMDCCVLQTNNSKDVEYIRKNSADARIWFLKDAISDSDMELIQNNSVECVNILSSSEKNMQRIKRLSDSEIDVCIWNVQSEQYKNSLLENGATYVMTDFGFDVSPYQEGDYDFNGI